MKFYLHTPNDSSSLVYITVSYNYLRSRLSTSISVNPKYWDKKNQRVTRSQYGFIIINNEINRIRYEVSDYITQLKITKSKLDLQTFEGKIRKILNPNKVSENNRFFEKFEQWVKYRLDNKQINKRTFDNYTYIIRLLKQFQLTNNKQIKFESINQQLLEEFATFLYKEKKTSNNTIQSLIKLIKAYLNAMADIVGIDFQFKPLKMLKKYDTPSVVLTEGEIERLREVELSGIEDIVRKLFLIQIYILVRYSDLQKIEPYHFNKERATVKIVQQKTRSEVEAPISEKIKGFLEEWNYTLPKISHKTYNQYLKIVCKKSGIDTQIEQIRFRGIERITEVHQKYELISSHTARRTGITLLVDKIPMEHVRKISGHRSISSLMKYVRFTQQEAIEKARNAFDC